MKAPSKTRPLLRPYLIRLGIVSLISLVFAVIFNEATYMLQKEPSDRAPTTIQLVIPAGTAERVGAGQPVPSIPEEMIFVIGDVLEVVNQDSISHQLGPIWVPAGATGSLVMDKVDRVSYSCSFKTQKYLGLEVRPPTTISTRIAALGLTVPTLAALLFLYSLAAYPMDRKAKPPAAKEQA
jgi:hypothetical protein